MSVTVIFLLSVLFATSLVLFVIIIPMWKIFTKAGQSGWKALIPIYNTYILVEIAGLPWWVFLGVFIPAINFVVLIVILYHVSKRFGHDMGYTLGMIFLPFIFFPVIAYGSSVYTAPQTEEKPATPNNPPATSAQQEVPITSAEPVSTSV